MLDTQSNSVTLVTPQAEAAELKIECRFKIEQHRVRSAQELPLAAHAQRWPFDYSGEERRDLGAMLEPHYLDPDGRLYEWMRPFFSQAARPDTKELLMSLADAIKAGLSTKCATKKARRPLMKRLRAAREVVATMRC